MVLICTLGNNRSHTMQHFHQAADLEVNLIAYRGMCKFSVARELKAAWKPQNFCEGCIREVVSRINKSELAGMNKATVCIMHRKEGVRLH